MYRSGLKLGTLHHGLLNAEQGHVLKLGHFRLAKRAASVVQFQYKIGAVLCRNGKPINVGRNKPKETCKFYAKYHPTKTTHAEADVVSGMPSYLVKGSTVYVYREGFDGATKMAKPCSSCIQMLRDLEVKKIRYTTDLGFKEEKI